MSSLTPAATKVFRQHHGVATGQMLTDSGVGPRARRRLVEEQILDLLFKRVYRITSAPITLESRCVALCFAHPSGFVSGPTAGRLEGYRRMPASEQIHFTVPHGLHIEYRDDIVLHQSTAVTPADVTKRSDGITVASPQRLLLDLAATLSTDDLLSVIEQSIQKRRCTFFSLVYYARRLSHPRRTGSLRFARLLIERGNAPALESHPEVVLEMALKRKGIPIVRQVRLLDLPDHPPIRIDLSIPELRWAIEIDVHPDHLLLQGTTKDKRRDRQCHVIGWQVDRVTELDMLDVETLADELESVYLARLASINVRQSA